MPGVEGDICWKLFERQVQQEVCQSPGDGTKILHGCGDITYSVYGQTSEDKEEWNAAALQRMHCATQSLYI